MPEITTAQIGSTLSQEQICLDWRHEFEPVLVALNMRLDGLRAPSDILFVARALLKLAQDGRQPTAVDVVDFVCLNDQPAEGQPAFNRDELLTYVPVVYESLVSSDPRASLGLSD